MVGLNENFKSQNFNKNFKRGHKAHIFRVAVDGCSDGLKAIKDGWSDQASSQPLPDFGIIVNWIEKELNNEKIELGKGRVIQEGKQVCILSLGTRLEECKIAAEELKNKGVSTTIVDARFAKPLDQELILKCAREHEVMITIEEGSIGGFGSHVENLLSEKGVFDKGLKFRSMTLPDVFIEQDNPKKCMSWQV